MSELLGLDIRYSNLNDEAYLREWLQFPGILHWFPMFTEVEVEDAIKCWIGFSRFNSSLTATLNGVPCGIGTLFLMPYRKVAHHCLFKMIIDPKYQKKGIGSSLLKNLKHLAKNYFPFDLMHIEVVEGNPILSILKKFDFHQFVRQERYFKENGNYYARILMESDLHQI